MKILKKSNASLNINSIPTVDNKNYDIELNSIISAEQVSEESASISCK